VARKRMLRVVADDPGACRGGAMVRSSYPGVVPADEAPPVRLAELIGALSHALDMTEEQPPGHCIRCCWIGVHVGRAMGLDPRLMPDLYYTLLLKDLGCSSNAARICSLYLADDISFKRGFKTIDGSLGAALRFVSPAPAWNRGWRNAFAPWSISCRTAASSPAS